MDHLFAYIFVVCLVILALFIIAFVFKSRTQIRGIQQQLHLLKDQLNASLQQTVKHQQQKLNTVEQENIEQYRLIQRMDGEITKLQQHSSALTRQLQELQLSDPEVKLYQQAKKLIASGTSIDELVESCGIPRAEAELLYSLHQQSNPSE
jgi:predicted PurR-regulated permease PerM